MSPETTRQDVEAVEAAIVRAGEAAYAQGKGPEDNPYARGMRSHELWYAGWARAAGADPRQRR